MKFDIEIIIRTKPVGSTRTEMVESATVTVEAGTYNEALGRTFEALKTVNTFSDFMDRVNLSEVKYHSENKES